MTLLLHPRMFTFTSWNSFNMVMTTLKRDRVSIFLQAIVVEILNICLYNSKNFIGKNSGTKQLNAQPCTIILRTYWDWSVQLTISNKDPEISDEWNFHSSAAGQSESQGLYYLIIFISKLKCIFRTCHASLVELFPKNS